MDIDFPLSSNLKTSTCVDESGLLQSSENVDQANTPTGTFVKVHKSGSFENWEVTANF